jgi:arginine repressor
MSKPEFEVTQTTLSKMINLKLVVCRAKRRVQSRIQCAGPSKVSSTPTEELDYGD